MVDLEEVVVHQRTVMEEVAVAVVMSLQAIMEVVVEEVLNKPRPSMILVLRTLMSYLSVLAPSLTSFPKMEIGGEEPATVLREFSLEIMCN